MSTILLHMVWPYANLECRSEMCCTRLAGNTGRKNDAKIAICARCRTTLSGSIFATEARIDSRKKIVKQHSVLHMSSQYGELWPTNGWDQSGVWGTPVNFNGFHVLAALQHIIQVVGVSQALRRWAEGATYIRQGGHHVGVGPHSSL